MIGVVYGYYVKHGGVGRYISSVFQHLDSPKEVELITLEGNLPLWGVNQRTLSCKRDKSFLSKDENLEFSKAVQDVQGEYSAIHSYGIYHLSPDIYTAQICFDKYITSIERFFGELPAGYSAMKDLEKEMVKKSKTVIAASEMVAENLTEAYGLRDIKVIRGASRLPIVKDIPERNRDCFRAGVIGGNLQAKGLTFCNDALNLLYSKGIQVELSVAGTNEEIKTFFKNNARYPFELLGKVDVDENFYDRLDALMVLSVYEAYSLSALEAMARGIPVISSNLVGLFHDESDKKGLARVKNINDSEEVANKIEQILLDNQIRREAVEDGLKIARTKNWKDVATQYQEIYKSLKINLKWN